MNDTNATTTGTAQVDEDRGLKCEVRAQVAGDGGQSLASRLRTLCLAPCPTRPNRLALGLLGAVVTAAAVWSACRWWNYAHMWVKTDNAYVAAHIHQVSSRVAGTVSEVLVQENQAVAAGQVVARLDARDFEIRRQQALGQVAQAQAQVQQANAQIAQARAQVARERASATKARQDFERAKALFHDAAGAISRQEFEAAQAGTDAAQAALEAAESGLKSADALALAAQAHEQVACANLHDAELQLSYTDILAPAAGRIGKKNLETGNRVQPGQALLALVEPEVWVVANFKETQLARVKAGQPVRLCVDALPGRVFLGHVESLAPASGAQFALLPPDNATGNFTKIVQRVPVKIALDRPAAGECEGRLVPGMSTVVQIKVRE